MLVTQRKTNWKFLAIVFILAAIVGGGILWRLTKEKIKSTTIIECEMDKQYKPEECKCPKYTLGHPTLDGYQICKPVSVGK